MASNAQLYAAGSALAVTVVFVGAVVAAVVVRKRDQKKLKLKEKERTQEQIDYYSKKHQLQAKIDVLEEQAPKPNASWLQIAESDRALKSTKVGEWAETVTVDVGAKTDEWVDNVKTDTVVETPADSRHKNVPTNKETQIVLEKSGYRTTMNCTLDFYGNKILVGQAPIAARIAEHLETLCQENVGVLLWVGSLIDDNGNERIYAYVPIVKNLSVCFQKFRITTTNTILNENGCNTFYFDLAFGQEKRQMTLIHIPLWPSEKASPNSLLLAESLRHIANEQKNRFSVGLPSIAAHCSNGIRESSAAVVAYIGWQMLMHTGWIDPIGIAKRLRQYRHSALSTKILSLKELNVQVATIAGVLRVIADRVSELEDDKTLAIEFDKKPIASSKAKSKSAVAVEKKSSAAISAM